MRRGYRMFKKQMFIFLVAVVASTFITMGWVTPSTAADTVKIGSIWGLSGPGSQLGVVCKDAAVLAVEWINGKGGITVQGKKYKIELVIEDNKNTAAGSSNAATKLVHKDKIKFITGMNVPFQQEAVQTVTEPNKVVLSMGKTGLLIQKNRFSFAATNGFTVPIPGMFEFLKKNYPAAKTVAFNAHDEAGGLAVDQVGRMFAEKMGYKLFDTVLTQFGTKEYYPTWTKMLNSKPDAAFIGISFPDSLAANVRQARELGFKGPIVSVGTGDSSVFLSLIGKEYSNDFVYAGFDMNAPDNPVMVKTIMKLWETKYKKPFNLDGLDGWSTVWALAQAIEKAQSFDTEKVVKAWETMQTIETPWGTGAMGGQKVFGINHMVLCPAPISMLKNGKVEATHWYKPDM
jgi:branched-chain amino acid transport system substrate-binding protein